MNEATAKAMKSQVKEVEPIQPGYLRTDAAALYLNVTPQFLKDRIADGTAPKRYILSTRCKLFKISDLDKWVGHFLDSRGTEY